ncbi:MAG TPA: hypothetical protein VKB80_00410 [Kofleriaceae bacterium]|nr:hypothetical protein [Kofleriaceae bacterium]
MDKSHVPTGFLLFEDLIRFLINDLGVRSPRKTWHQRLIDSEKRFHQEFNTKIKGA